MAGGIQSSAIIILNLIESQNYFFNSKNPKNNVNKATASTTFKET